MVALDIAVLFRDVHEKEMWYASESAELYFKIMDATYFDGEFIISSVSHTDQLREDVKKTYRGTGRMRNSF